MKLWSLILSLLAVCAAALFMSCSSNDNGTSLSPMYDLRRLSLVEEQFAATTVRRSAPMIQEKLPGPVNARMEPDTLPGALDALSMDAAGNQRTFTYEYGDNAHLYWTSATLLNADGSTFATGIQTLDDDGFPTRGIWHYDTGEFLAAYDFTYDKTLYLLTSRISYREDPTDNPDALREYKLSKAWTEDGILATETTIIYDQDGIIVVDRKYRSITLKNVLRGTGGVSAYEYGKVYEEGRLVFEINGTFDSDGYPKTVTYREYDNGEVTWEASYHYEITKTVEGYLESRIFVNDETGNRISKTTYAYDESGLLKTIKQYEIVDDEFVLDTIGTVVWYRNPVNGPTGGEMVHFYSDEAGKPVGEYETIEWTETQKVNHYYSAPGEEASRETRLLEKIELPLIFP
ncbi:MAG: hypothetical protein GY846_04260 [Deltaproteobacteria bacterium]|nr:hypothetical protein [Deltaproteobacteria bacterium]